MHRSRRAWLPGRATVLAVVLASLAALLPVGRPLQVTSAAEVGEAADIVLVLDFSSSILDDQETRMAFADALDRIAARAEETVDTLVAGDLAVSMVIFASSAANVPGCTGLELGDNPGAVGQLAFCLREVASTYRNGGSDVLEGNIGDDTNYVDALEQAAPHLPADSLRPAIIFFSDGRHEVADVPVSEVIPARDRLFGGRTPFGLLPVGLGVDPVDRPVLEAGLADLRVTALERCDGGPFEWPDVVFETAEAAGQAVAVALQDVSCTFTVEPSLSPSPPPTPIVTPPPTPPPTPAPTPPPGGVRGVRLVAGDSEITIEWSPPTEGEAAPVEDYQVRCRPSEGGDWIESSEGVSTETSATVEGLENGVEYSCEIGVVRGGTPGSLTQAGTTAPFGRPPAPSKPTVEVLDGGARVAVGMPPLSRVNGFAYECSSDGGTSWSVRRDVRGDLRTAEITGLTNGVEYTCRASAVNERGTGEPSPVSDVFRPCSGLLDCNPAAVPWLGLLAFLLAAYLLYLLVRWLAGRRVYVTASVDGLPSVTLGRGPNVGMRFVKLGPYRGIVTVEPANGRAADARVRFRGGIEFEVRAGKSSVRTEAGRVFQVTDAHGKTHNVVLGAFDEEPQPLRRVEE